ncbi:OmpA family protein [Halomonas campisalis]|uniref:OmpA family protein n=1 Tax=Billgrantia campisalis TaxID=74661 RepID=A0ABS9P328_9GAMM|nr:OmpA family protein [Halomonas campisalis]MCG6656193.1 OmpA family protein [Halomonas campisalis]MDR5861379.1 OmpA family protein [Halomonas campisalis]
MLDRSTRDTLQPMTGDGDGEGWLMSYLDVLTLLITLFVLLLSMMGNGMATQGSQYGGQADQQITPEARVAALVVAGRLSPGLQPRHDGLQPRFSGLDIEGVSVDQGQQGITLRIDDNLLFASGQAELTVQGREVVASLREVLDAFDGEISVEGHTDSIPISTARFPSNWELSSARAIAVLRHLDEVGVEAKRMRAVGYADTRPLESNETAEGRAANRRVELLLRKGVGAL